jgi:hypothetical protein
MKILLSPSMSSSSPESYPKRMAFFKGEQQGLKAPKESFNNAALYSCFIRSRAINGICFALAWG